MAIRSSACETFPRARVTTLVTNLIKSSEAANRTTSIGKGVEEIRVLESSGAYRVIYFARRADAVYVLHAFHKRTQRTPKKDIEIAKRRFGQLLGGRI